MKRLIQRIYSRQNEISWRKLAEFTDCFAWAALYVLVLALLALASV